MARYRRNWVEPLAGDGKDRSHVLKLPFWTVYLRVVQIVFAVVLLALTAFAASQIGSQASGFGLTWFSVILTIIYFVWLGVSLFAYPDAYLAFMHLPAELLLNVFWLCAWALLASEAVSVGRLESFLGDDLARVPAVERSAFACLQAAAAVGAVEWVLFVVSAFVVLFASVRSLVRGSGSSGSSDDGEAANKPAEMGTGGDHGPAAVELGSYPAGGYGNNGYPGGAPNPTATGVPYYQ